MYEKLADKPIGRKKFYRRMLNHFMIVVALVLVSLVIGVIGFMVFENTTLQAAFLNTSMLLSGLGLVEKPSTSMGHWFIGIYGLYAGLIFIVVLGILITPAIHRIIHTLHWSK